MSQVTEQQLEQLTLDDKAALISGADLWHTVAVERLDIPAIMCADGPHGLRAQVGDIRGGDLLSAAPATGGSFIGPASSEPGVVDPSTWGPTLGEPIMQ